MIDDFDQNKENNNPENNPENTGNGTDSSAENGAGGGNNGSGWGNNQNQNNNGWNNAQNQNSGSYNNGYNYNNYNNGNYNSNVNGGTNNNGQNSADYDHDYDGSGYKGYNSGSNNNNWNQGWSGNQNNSGQYDQYGGNIQYKWNYDDYQKALNENNKAKSKKKRGLKPFIITISSVLAVAVIGLAVVGVMGQNNNNNSNNTVEATTNPGSTETLNIQSQPSTSSNSVVSGKAMTTEQIASSLTPAVVGIEIYNLTSIEPSAEGSGIIMSKEGYIVTNAHVIEGAQKIRVVLSSGKEYDNVKTIGQDTKTDLAVLKIDATDVTAAKFGNSDQLKVGQPVVAIGNPGGLALASTVTDGIISGLNRSVSTSASTSSDVTYIQTNAQINPGNSGGALVNMYGQVIGINTAKISVQGYEGIGFAIPINTAKPVVDSIIAHGYVTGRVKVGISVYSLSNSQARWYNYPSGLYVESIEKTCDAYAKGLRTKDIITAINGISLASDDSSKVFNTFYNEEKKHKVGETITLTVYRTGTNSTMKFNVKLEEDKGDSEPESTENRQNNDDFGNNGNSGNGEYDYWSQFFK
jgi:serine protease Do